MNDQQRVINWLAARDSGMNGHIGGIGGLDGASSSPGVSAIERSISSSVTCLETLQIVHKWTVENFPVHMELCNVHDSLTSSVFGSNDGRYKFTLRLFPTGKDDECRGYVSLFLIIRECPEPRIRFRVNFFIETTEGPRGCALNRNIVTINKGGIVTASKFFAMDFLKTRAQRFLPNDSLTVGCELSVFGETVNKDLKEEEVKDCVILPESSLSLDMKQLLQSESHTDCELVVDGKRFRAHKGILAVRSPVFAAMFDPNHDMIEAQKNECEIEDLTPTAVGALLQYAYTDTCPQLTDYAEDILPAADKYQLVRLKMESEVELSKSLTPDNVCRRLKLADKHSAPMLKERSLTFLRQQSTDVLKSPSWGELERDDPVLAAATLKELVIERRPSASSEAGPSAKKPRLN